MAQAAKKKVNVGLYHLDTPPCYSANTRKEVLYIMDSGTSE